MSNEASSKAVNGAAILRTNMRTNVRYRFELLAAISKVSRDHGIDVDNETIGNLVLVDASEIEKALAGPDLPGGTNC
ncbi:hypothetical protein CUJ87_03145 [Paraburkholderia caledonica]|jgi:hypothetical protein|nr:hypothetical protein CUJ87_03145 [Paraburkholderia caledonica]